MISVVIPALNEGGCIADVVKQVFDIFEKEKYIDAEVIVIDDGSIDSTGKLAAQAGARVITNPMNMGYGFSIKKGVRVANHEVIVITDADGTYPVEKIPDLVSRHTDGIDMVVGARSGVNYKESYLKWWLRTILRFVVEFVATRKIPDINSGLRLFTKTNAIHFENRLCDTFSYTTSITLAFQMNGLFVDYIDIGYDKRVGKTKVRLLSDSFRAFQYVLQAAAYYDPLKIFLLMSIVTLLCSIGLFGFGVATQFSTAFIIGSGLALMSVLFIALGMLADILKQVSIELRNNKNNNG